MRQKKALLLCLKIFFSTGLILWITHNVPLEQVWLVIADAHVALLFFAFSLFFVGYFITAFRWRMLIRAQGGDAPVLYRCKGVRFSNRIFFLASSGDWKLIFSTFKSAKYRSESFGGRTRPAIVSPVRRPNRRIWLGDT